MAPIDYDEIEKALKYWNRDIEPHGVRHVGDNYRILADPTYRGEKRIEDETVDLVLTDAPYCSNVKYNITLNSESQLFAYRDTWKWSPQTQHEYNELMKVDKTNPDIVRTIGQFYDKFFDERLDMLSYLVSMCYRLIPIRKTMKRTASIYFQCDQTASHYIKDLLDSIFGWKNFRNEIIWCYTGPGPTTNYFRKKNDRIFFYSKTDDYYFNEKIRIPYKAKYTSARGLHGKNYDDEEMKRYRHSLGKVPEDWWTDITNVSQWRDELVGFPTQKPEALVARMIEASSKPWDVVFDPFCGSGTTPLVAEKLKRRWIASDISSGAIAIMDYRFRKYNQRFRFGPAEGVSKTYDDLYDDYMEIENYTGSEQLEMRRNFQWRVMWLLNAIPSDKKMKLGKDGGIDGHRMFRLPNEKVLKMIIEAKSGNISVKDVGYFESRLRLKKAQMGVMVYFKKPTSLAFKDAKNFGLIDQPAGCYIPLCPKIQMIDIRDLLDAEVNHKPIPLMVPSLPDITIERNLKKQKRKMKFEDNDRSEYPNRDRLSKWV